ncbi:MAG: hypothetical protein K8J31_28325, partial [Anaerolineae bacterium]|nr:hypothetical protein [Anaerolineae bacterium]
MNPPQSQTSRRVLLVELTSVHGFVLYPQCLLLLEAGYEVTILINAQNLERELLSRLRDRVTWIELPDSRYVSLARAFFQAFRGDYDFILFNTFTPLSHGLFEFLQRRPIRFIVHNWKATRFNQGPLHPLLLRKADRIYVLSPQVYAHTQAHLPVRVGSKLSLLHLVYYPDHVHTEPYTFSSPDGRVHFAILGQIKNWRNFAGLMANFERISQSPLADQIAIHVLGRASNPLGQQFIGQARAHGLLGSVIHVQAADYEPFDRFAEQLQQCHFILPLIDHTVLPVRKYGTMTASSSLMLSRAFSVPLVASTDYTIDADLEPYALRYA